MQPQEFDPKKAIFHSIFRRFEFNNKPVALVDSGLDDDAELVVYDFDGFRGAFDLMQLAYHHLTQGEQNGKPFMVSFCGVCNTAMGFIPVIEGRVHQFRPGGLYNGLIMLQDDETNTYWNHISGEAMYGPLLGKQLEPFNLDITTVKAESQRSNPAPVHLSKLKLMDRIFTWTFHRRKKIAGKGLIPFFFKWAMPEVDGRLPKLEQGLGVMINKQARFYPVKFVKHGIEDELAGQKLTISIDEIAGVPHAIAKDGSRPIQLLTRWYGFSLTFPDCDIYKKINE